MFSAPFRQIFLLFLVEIAMCKSEMLGRVCRKIKRTAHLSRYASLTRRNWETNTISPTQSDINKWVDDYLSNPTPESRQQTCSDLILKSNQFSSESSSLISLALSSSDDGIKFGMALRSDVLELLRKKNPQNEGLNALDTLLANWLFAVFCISALKLQRVTFDTSSGLLLERIAADEAVHRIRALSEMKNRLTNGRRCFGFFHPWYSQSLLPLLVMIFSLKSSK
jgi:hypothetical protein